MDKSDTIVPRFGDGVDVNPYVPKQLRMPTVDTIEGAIRTMMREDPITPTCCETYREQIAHLIRLLTYRELCQIGDEIEKCKAESVAQTLDDWAHMVKEETNVRTEEK